MTRMTLNPHVIGSSPLGTAFAIVAIVFSMASLNVAHGATLTPHRAFYEMQLGDADQNSDVQAVSGRSAFTLDRDCSGWLSTEEYLIEFQGKEGNRNRILSSFESWESDTGEMYSFDVSERSSFQSDKDFSGYANLTSSSSNAHFSLVGEDVMELPDSPLYDTLSLSQIDTFEKSTLPVVYNLRILHTS